MELLGYLQETVAVVDEVRCFGVLAHGTLRGEIHTQRSHLHGVLVFAVIAHAHLHIESAAQGIAELSRHGAREEIAVGQHRAVERGEHTTTSLGYLSKMVRVVDFDTLHAPLQHLGGVSMNRNTVRGAARGHSGKHRSGAGRVGHTSGIARSLLHAEHAGAHLRHLVQRHLLIDAWLHHHFAQLRDVLSHAQVQYHLLTGREQLLLQQHRLVADERGSDGMSTHGHIFNHEVAVNVRDTTHRDAVFHCDGHTDHRFARRHVTNLSSDGLRGLRPHQRGHQRQQHRCRSQKHPFHCSFHIKYYFQIDRKGTLFCLLHQISGIFCRVL